MMMSVRDNHVEKPRNLLRLNLTLATLVLMLFGTTQIFVVEQALGDALLQIAIVAAFLGLAAIAGHAYGRRNFVTAGLGLVAVIALDLGTSLVFPLRDRPFLFLPPEFFVFLGVSALFVWLAGVPNKRDGYGGR